MDQKISIALFAAIAAIGGALIAFLASWLTARETNKAAARLERVQFLRQQREKRISKLRDLLTQLADTTGAALTQFSSSAAGQKKPTNYDWVLFKQVGAMMAHVPPGSVARAWSELFEHLESYSQRLEDTDSDEATDDLADVRDFIEKVNRVHEAIDEFVVGTKSE